MTHKMNTVKLNHITRTNTRNIVPKIPSAPSARASVISQSTSESCACARDSAQSRR